MDKLLEQFHFAHREALTNYRSTHGPGTPAFWRLGDLRVEPFDADELRIQLRDAMLQGTFRDIHVPAFLTFVQTQAAGHSHRLWKETVIPLLAGEGPKRDELTKRLKQMFAGEDPFRAALRAWLKGQGRDHLYLQDGWHFWFVRATIGECALAGVSKEFTEEFLNSLVRESLRTGDLQEVARARFCQLISSPPWSDKPKKEVRSIQALEDCLVEAGTFVLRVFEYLANHAPPAEGWDLNALILKVQGNNPAAFPPVVKDFVRNRLQVEVGDLTLDQLLALLRANPGCRFHTPAGTWDLTHLEPPPVCHASLYRGNNRLGSFDLTDDLGRRAEELQRLLPGHDWQATDEFVWRLHGQFFKVAHPSRLRSQARAVFPPGGTASPSLWVLTLAGDQFLGPGDLAGRTPTRFLLHAWPTLDADSQPAFRVRSFHLPVGWTGGVQLGVSSEFRDDCKTVWEGSARRGEVRVNRTVPARPGEKTLFRLAGESPASRIQTRHVAYSWPLPALFVEGKRLRPGRHLVAAGGRLSLVGKERPALQGTAAPPRQTSLESDISRWDFSAGSSPRLVVEAAGQRWELECRAPLTVRAWLEPAPSTKPRPDRSRYRLTDDGIDLFFWDCPALSLEILGPTLRADDVQLQLGQLRLVAGSEDGLEGRFERPLSDLIETCGAGPFRIDLRAILPPALMEPGLDVRWLHLDDSSSSGQDLRFLQLPYTREILQPSGSGRPGKVSLEDTSGVWESLDLRPVGDPRLPVAGMMHWPSVPVRSEVVFLDYQIQGLVDLPVCGTWFQTERWTLPDLQNFLTNPQLGCGLAIVPANEKLRFQVETVEGRVLATRELGGPCSRDVAFADVFPGALQADQVLQNHWLTCPRSRLVCRQGDFIHGQVEIDLRGFVTTVEEISRQGPDPLGTTRITLKIGYRQGPAIQDDLDLLLLRTDLEPDAVVTTRRLTLQGEVFVENHRQEEVTLPDPGDYQVLLRRSGETEVMACRDLHASAPDVTTGLTLEAFLDVFPTSPTLDQVIRLFRFLQINRQSLQGEYAPWNQFRFYSRMDESWNQTTGMVHQLLGLLRGFANAPGEESFARIPPVDPILVPPQILLEVATVVLHLELNTPAYARPCLLAWERTLDRLRQEAGISQDARHWAEILHCACQTLRGQGVPASPLAAKPILGEDPWFPCQAPFLDFLTC